MLLQVLLPYVKSKCDQLYAKHSQRGVLGLVLARAGQQQQQQVWEACAVRTAAAAAAATLPLLKRRCCHT